jgi:hypothetical protein
MGSASVLSAKPRGGVTLRRDAVNDVLGVLISEPPSKLGGSMLRVYGM